MRWLGRIPYRLNRGRSFKVWPRTLLNRVFPVRLHTIPSANAFYRSTRPRSVPFVTSQGYKIRATKDHGKGQPAPPLRYQMVPGVLPSCPHEGKGLGKRK